MENIFVEFLPPWIETGRQPAFYDKESGSVLQQTARMYARVNMLIRMFNKLSKQTKQTVEEYIDKFNELHDYVMDYFANLDVQEEINNKLDDMTEAGTLQEIVASYLNSRAVFGYDSVSEMKSADNLLDGSYAKTSGFVEINDGGGATYKIRTATEDDVVDNMTLIELDSGLIAQLLIEPTMTTRQFGSSVNADVNVLTKALSLCETVILSDNMTIAPQQVQITGNHTFDLDGHKITMGDNNNIEWANLIRVNTSGLITIKNGELDGNSAGQTVAHVINNTGILVTTGNCIIENMKIHDFLYEGIITNGHTFTTVKECNIYDCGRNGIAFLSWDSVVVENCEFSGSIENQQNIANIDVEPYTDESFMGPVDIRNCLFKDDEMTEAIQTYLDANQHISAEVRISDCTTYNRISIGHDTARRSSYTLTNIVFREMSDRNAFLIYDTVNDIRLINAKFVSCAYPIKVTQSQTFYHTSNVKIDCVCLGTLPTKGIEFELPEGTLTYPHPLENFDITILNSNTITGWQLLHNSTIKTNPYIDISGPTLDFNHFWSDIYLTGWGSNVNLDTVYQKTTHINPSFTVHTNNTNQVRSEKLPQMTNIGNGGVQLSNGASFSITVHNWNYDNFIVDNITGVYTARTIS